MVKKTLNGNDKIKPGTDIMATAARFQQNARIKPVVDRSVLIQRLKDGALGLGLIAAALALLVAIITYNAADPSLNTATDAAPANLLGRPGAYGADFVLQWFGLAALALIIPPLAWGIRLVRGRAVLGWKVRTLWMVVSLIVLAVGLAVISLQQGWVIPAGFGGALGQVVWTPLRDMLLSLDDSAPLWTTALVLFPLGLAALGASLGLDRADWASLGRAVIWPFTAFWARARGTETQADADDVYDDDTETGDLDTPLKKPLRRIRREPVIEELQGPRITQPKAPAAKPSKRAESERQRTLGLGDDYELPPLDLLTASPKRDTRPTALDTAALEQNARLLESVLDDFGVEGRIKQVKPGPVVTLYELEPAPGIKSSRVIGLADDIARSMSAISARVAVVPGRNVIGIELPNVKRETVLLRELLASAAFEQSNGLLPLVLGKDLSGEPAIADLAPMPHLLIAGSTGSGKSVGLNAMILSLLYRLTPDECRFIMIDPKMLELSIYDGIPHLLTPVVTEPKKAIVALKWAVREMDERYRKMSKLGVRNLAGFNEKVTEAQKKGRGPSRRVLTGYDRDSGNPIYEDQNFDYEPMPLIVLIVDELADLMMVAGKEIEFLVQRLAQKARAAGIHLILATQRPSVDVITGVIKANLPTRISFAVTNKIDSRTILNEQGAEQLLGKGDMLYVSGGKQLSRVHGPFVSDEEVERVADHWRTQGSPDYLDAVTEDPEEDSSEAGGLDGGEDGEDDLYTKAMHIVASEQKASTSFIQRHLRIGYNSAARLIEQMEKQGIVSAPNHVGRREVLIGEDGTRR
jgi:DNA segregation ATPase FtsK/SpoIIIE, S-DNA-T family